MGPVKSRFFERTSPTLIVEGWTQSTKDLDAIFEKYDRDKNKYIDRDELLECLKDLLHFIPKHAQLTRIYNDLDANGDGKITKEEFRRLFSVKEKHAKTVLRSKQIMTAFEKFDKNKDDKLSFDELMEGLNSLPDCNYSQEEVKEIMEDADLNKDGHVDFNEFVKYLV